MRHYYKRMRKHLVACCIVVGYTPCFIFLYFISTTAVEFTVNLILSIPLYKTFSGGKFVEDKNSFLFTLASKTGALPTKLPQLADVGGIWGNSSYGPCFGSTTGISLSFVNAANSSACSANNSHSGFEFPAHQDVCSFIQGSATFTMNYLEVFGLKDAY